MNKAQKWNPTAHIYEPYEIPDNWTVPLYTADMNMIVNCAACGKKIKYGDGYNSKLIHNSIGLAYMVCKDCMEKEHDSRNDSRRKEGEESPGTQV